MQSAARQSEAEAFFSKLRDEGKLPPALFENALALDGKLDDAARAEMRALFGKLNPIVDTSGSHVADKNKAKEDKAGVSLNARIQAFQAEHKLTSFEEAAKALFAQKPELFNAETDDDGGEAA